MTSQLVLINQGGVALASDTLTSRQEERGEIKTIPSNSKIHAVGEDHLIAVLHNNQVFLGHVQWSTLVREWSLSLENPLPHVIDYANHFVEWFESNSDSLHYEESYMVARSITAEFEELFSEGNSKLSKALKEASATPEAVSNYQVDEEVVAAIQSYQENCFKAPPFQDLKDRDIDELLERSKFDYFGRFKSYAEKFGAFEFGQSVKECVDQFVRQLLIRFVNSNDVMNLNFVGFGTRDFFGQRVELSIRSFYAGGLRYVIRCDGSSDPTDYPAWFPLAQQSAINAFMYGIDDDSWAMLAEIAFAAVAEVASLDETVLDQAREKFSERSREFLFDRFAIPLSQTVSTLNTGSMARLAEMLVRFQCLRSASMAGEATVGGFVESLFITRDGGIDWVRKFSIESHPIEDASHVFG
jgi:hypothetical protein